MRNLHPVEIGKMLWNGQTEPKLYNEYPKRVLCTVLKYELCIILQKILQIYGSIILGFSSPDIKIHYFKTPKIFILKIYPSYKAPFLCTLRRERMFVRSNTAYKKEETAIAVSYLNNNLFS